MAVIEPVEVLLPGGEGCLVRTAAEADAAELLEFETHANATSPHAVREPDEVGRSLDEEREFIRQRRDATGHLMIVAREPAARGEGPIVGALLFRNGERRKVSHHGHFGISVHALWRGRGVGTALMTAMLDWAAAHPVIEKVCLGVFATNTRARTLYQRLGFTDEGRYTRYFKIREGEYVDDIQMSIFVKPGVAPEGFRTWTAQRSEPST